MQKVSPQASHRTGRKSGWVGEQNGIRYLRFIHGNSCSAHPTCCNSFPSNSFRGVETPCSLYVSVSLNDSGKDCKLYNGIFSNKVEYQNKSRLTHTLKEKGGKFNTYLLLLLRTKYFRCSRKFYILKDRQVIFENSPSHRLLHLV